MAACHEVVQQAVAVSMDVLIAAHGVQRAIQAVSRWQAFFLYTAVKARSTVVPPHLGTCMKKIFGSLLVIIIVNNRLFDFDRYQDGVL